MLVSLGGTLRSEVHRLPPVATPVQCNHRASHPPRDIRHRQCRRLRGHRFHSGLTGLQMSNAAEVNCRRSCRRNLSVNRSVFQSVLGGTGVRGSDILVLKLISVLVFILFSSQNFYFI